jgi:polygalacturonase
MALAELPSHGCRNVLFINNTMRGGVGGCRLKSDVLRGGYVTNACRGCFVC